MLLAKVVGRIGGSEKKQDKAWSSGDRSKEKQEYGIELAFGIERKKDAKGKSKNHGKQSIDRIRKRDL